MTKAEILRMVEAALEDDYPDIVAINIEAKRNRHKPWEVHILPRRIVEMAAK